MQSGLHKMLSTEKGSPLSHRGTGYPSRNSGHMEACASVCTCERARVCFSINRLTGNVLLHSLLFLFHAGAHTDPARLFVATENASVAALKCTVGWFLMCTNL